MAELNPSGTKVALLAAIDYINENPCDPDIYITQLAAWDIYTKALANLGLDQQGKPINANNS